MGNRKYLTISLVIFLAFLITACGNNSIQQEPTELLNTTMDSVSLPSISDNDSPDDLNTTQSEEEMLATYTHNHKIILNHMNYVLPDDLDLISGEFDIFLGGGGGIPFLKKDDPGDATQYGGVELQLGIDGIFENGKLIGVQSFSNHSMFSEFTSFLSSIPCVTVYYSYDIYDEDAHKYVGEGNRWYAFWAVESTKPVYALYLNADYYDYEDLVTIAESVTFSEGAFTNK